MHQLRNLTLTAAAFATALLPSMGALGAGSFGRVTHAPAEHEAPAVEAAAAPEAAPVRPAPVVTPVTAPPSLELATAGWKGKKTDNICGIDDLKKVSNPAEVDYPDLMASTPQMKRIEKDGIDPESPQGKILRQEAVRLITKTCEVVRRQKGYCGIWKAIAHEDARSITDATGYVKAELQ